ncbi:MAG: hypothetical protein GYB53_15065 [Rhodobacteraceae bacterium]|nr:hypothetical protein [Paracoccaceae bacterium]MBR9823730.1 hypothetical protein [Paracoccaceae bacterium]
MKTLLPSDRAAVVGVIDPDAYAANTYTTGWISMSAFQSIMACIMAGDLGASATVDAKIEQATDDSGSDAKDVAGAAITQLTKAGSDDNKQAVINCNAEDLDLANDFTHARLSVTVATAACDVGAVVLGFDPRYGPASDSDLASVDEIVAL